MGVRDWWRGRDSRRRTRATERRREAEQDAALEDLTEIGTDYRAAPGPAHGTYRAPDPYGAYAPAADEPSPPRRRRRQRRRQQRRALPATPGRHPAVPPPPTSGARSGAATSAGASRGTGGTGTDGTDGTGRRRRRRKTEPTEGRSRTPRWYVVVPVVAVVVLLGGRLALGDGIGGVSFGPTPELEPAWELDGEALTGSRTDIGSVDGTVDGTVLPTDVGWIVVADGYDSGYSSLDSEAVVALVDPETGAREWTRELPGARCTLVDGTLLCLRAEDRAVELVELDVRTGEPVGGPVATDMDAPTFVLQPLADGLLAVDETGQLTHLALDGSTRWTEHARLPQWDPDVGETSAVVYPDAVWLSLRLGDVLVATTEGIALRTECHGVAALDDGIICSLTDTIGYSPLGEQRWVNDYSDARLVTRYQRVVEFAVGELGDGELGAIDPLTGEAGVQARIEDGEDRARSAIGDAQHPVVLTQDGAVLLLRPDASGKVWEGTVRDEYLSIAGGGVVDGVVVIDGELTHGLDLATGEELWTYDSPSGDLDVVDGRLLARDYDGIAVYELPAG